MKRTGIVDYGGGNIQSVRNAVVACGMDYVEISRPEHFAQAEALVFPGQGAFGDCMGELNRRGLTEPLRAWILAGAPFFGICIGYQVLFESSEENPHVSGLGVFPGKVVRFESQPGLKIPHMGWNTAKLSPKSVHSPAWRGLGAEPYFYFVHSYFPVPADESLIATTTEYGGKTFASSVEQGALVATQFHPEKSQDNGLRLLRNFAERFGLHS